MEAIAFSLLSPSCAWEQHFQHHNRNFCKSPTAKLQEQNCKRCIIKVASGSLRNTLSQSILSRSALVHHQRESAQATMPLSSSPAVIVLGALTFILSAYSQTPAASTPAPAPAVEPLAVSANISGSLGNLCSSQAGVLNLIQGSAANQDQAGLAISVPANLANAVAVQQTAQVSVIHGLHMQAKQLHKLNNTASLYAYPQTVRSHTIYTTRPAPAYASLPLSSIDCCSVFAWNRSCNINTSMFTDCMGIHLHFPSAACDQDLGSGKCKWHSS